jgi:Tfp pilus assembly protein PilN
MTQHINLYREILKQQHKQAIITMYLTLIMGAVLMFIVFNAYLLWDINTAETSLQNKQLTLKNEQLQIDQLAAQNANPVFNTKLVDDIKQLQINIDEAAKTLQIIHDRQLLSEKNFSGYLQALANQSDSSVWITAIHIAGKNRTLSVQGSTFNPEKVPQMLQRLQKEPTFSGQSFDKLVMEPAVKYNQQIDFTLSNYDQSLPVKANDK